MAEATKSCGDVIYVDNIDGVFAVLGNLATP
jgi:hypothetical protein